MKYEQTIESDFDAIKSLLDSYELPSSDIKEHFGNFFVAKEANVLVGVGGYETCEEYAFLRSFAVNESYRGLGIAESILKLVEGKAASSGVRSLYLLTETASKYFEKFGFSTCSRNSAPEVIQGTRQSSGLCPDTATMMHKDLGT